MPVFPIDQGLNRTLNKTRLTIPAIVALLVLSCTVCYALDSCSLMSQAEYLFMQREDMAKARESAEYYRKVLSADPDSLSASLRLARVLVYIGAQCNTPEEESQYYQEAIDVSRQASKLHPGKPGPHYWLGMACGLMGAANGGIGALPYIDEAKQQMAKVMKLDPDYDYGGAYRILGRMYALLPGIVGGDYDKAEQMLSKACKIGPQYLLNHLYLADVYIHTDRPNKAEKVLQQVVNTSTMSGLEPEDKLWKMHASRLLNTCIIR